MNGTIRNFSTAMLRAVAVSESQTDFCAHVANLVIPGSIQGSCIWRSHSWVRELHGIHSANSETTNNLKSETRILIDSKVAESLPLVFSDDNGAWRLENIEDPLPAKSQILLVVPPIVDWHGQGNRLELKFATSNDPILIDVSEFFILQWAFACYLQKIVVSDADLNQYDEKARNAHITHRQSTIIILVQKSLTNAQIASHIHVSEALVKLELSRIFKILGITKRNQLFDESA